MSKKIKNELIAYMIDNYDKSSDIKEICDKLVLSIQKDIAKNPSVYVSKYRDIKTGKVYLSGKAFFPIAINKQKEIKVYVGAIDEFIDGTKNINAKAIATKKVIKRMEQLINE